MYRKEKMSKNICFCYISQGWPSKNIIIVTFWDFASNEVVLKSHVEAHCWCWHHLNDWKRNTTNGTWQWAAVPNFNWIALVVVENEAWAQWSKDWPSVNVHQNMMSLLFPRQILGFFQLDFFYLRWVLSVFELGANYFICTQLYRGKLS